MDEGVGRDPRRDEEGRYTDPQSSKIIGRMTTLRDSVEFDAILRRRNVDRWRNVIRKTAMFVEVKDYQPGIPLVRRLASASVLRVEMTCTLSQY